MITFGADVNYVSDFYGDTPLAVATRDSKSSQITQLLIKKGADPLFINQKGASILMCAAIGGSSEIVKIILNYIPQDKMQDYVNNEEHRAGGSALLLNVRLNPSLDVVKLLVEHGANINHSNKMDRVCLEYAALLENRDIFDYLVSMGADVNYYSDKINLSSPLLQKMVFISKVEGVKRLIHAGADVNQQTTLGHTALTSAIYINNVEIAKILIEAGADLEIRDNCDMTALMDAVDNQIYGEHDMFEMVKLLVEAGADINARHSSYSTTVFLDAAEQDTTKKFSTKKILELFLQTGVNINQTNSFGKTALMGAVSDPEKVKLLIDYGADIHAVSSHQRTALLYAAQSSHLYSIKLLLNAGARVNHLDSSGETALFYAILGTSDEKKLAQTVKYLIKAGIDLDIQDKDGNTALMRAVQKNQQEVANILIKAGANTKLKNNQGQSVKILSKKRNNR